MRLTLERIRIQNFKGVRDREIVFGSKSANISGANGTGKTTLVDAFTWALFSTDSHGNSGGSDAFREKTLDENGEIIHNLTITVELDFLLDGERFNIKKTQEEIWQKRRGSTEATFGGNKNAYFINDIELKQTEYKQRIAAIADNEIFLLVSSLGAFNSMDWKKRRQQLLNLAGNDVDDQLLQRDEYRQLADEVGNRNVSVDDLRKILTDQRKNINNELKMLPVRIDEAKKSTPKLTPTEIRDAEYLVNESKHDVEKIDKMILDEKAKAGSDNQGAILAKQTELLSIKRRLLDEHDAERRKLQNAVDNASETFLRGAKSQVDVKKSLERVKSEYEQTVKKRDALRDEYMEAKRQPIEFDSNCPTCGQPLQEERIQEIQANLEGEKRKKLATIQVSGKELTATVKELEGKISELETELNELTDKVSNAQKERDNAMEALKAFPKSPDISSDERITALEAEIESLKAEQTGSPDEKIRQFEERKAELLAIADKNRKILMQRDVAKEIQERVKEYEKRQQDLGTQLSETEILIYQVEKFVADRCGALEDSINSHFPTIKWKLFDTQINGGMVDTCMCMVECNGTMVPYDSCNTASQINADIEVVNVLSDYYDIYVPLFIDGAEAVNNISSTKTQAITLSVGTQEKLEVTLLD